MNVLSLFDGMSCGRIALDRLGIKVDNYFASEIDKWAIKVSKDNYPDIVQLGDVRDIKGEELPVIDLFIGGSPCQGFSFAGKQLNFDDPRSKLFFEYVRILNELRIKNPDVKFLLENVNMKKEYQDVISSYLGVQPIKINSSLLSAQNRVRLYWTNIEGVTQPEDKGITLKDIVLTEGDFKYATDTRINYINGRKEMGYTKGIIEDMDGKAPCLLASMYKNLMHHTINQDMIVFGAAQRGRHLVDGVRKDYFGAPTEQVIEVSNREKSNCLTTVNKDTMICISEATKKGFVEIEDGDFFDYTFPNSKTRRGRLMKEKSNCLTAAKFDFRQFRDNTIRFITPVECERLQTVPDNYTACVSDSQRYKMLGNGWTVDVICHIFKNL
jgi:DNA-cytosine methyltransferase